MKIYKSAILGLALFGLSACGGSDSNNFTGTTSGGFNSTNTTTNTTTPPPGQATFNLTFASSGNANTTPLAAGGALTGLTQATPNSSNPTRLSSNFTQNIINGQTILLRTLTSTVAKTSAILPGDVFTYANPLATNGAFADYTEQGQPALKRWVSTGGTVTINSISAGSANVTLTNLILTPASDGGNTATGTITVNGTATLTF